MDREKYGVIPTAETAPAAERLWNEHGFALRAWHVGLLVGVIFAASAIARLLG